MTDQLVLKTRRLENVLAPTSVVVVGASSSRPWATGNQVIRNLRASAYDGRVEVVNPSGGEIEGLAAWTSMSEIERVDLAVIAVGPRAVLGALESVHASGIPAAIVMSVGLDGDQRAGVAEFARETGLTVHGPNCMGVINVIDNVMLWADEGVLTDLPKGSVGLISQSGSGAIFVARSMSGVGFSHVVSTGNETSISTADYIDFLVDDESTRLIGIIIESIDDADLLAKAVERARDTGKPVVALKVGRSSAGALATVAHTGAVLANDAVVSAFFEHVGVPLVRDYDELAAALELLAHLQGQSVGAGRIAAITISGGQAALTADIADRAGATLATLAEETLAALADVLPGAGINNPLDAGGSEAVEDDYYRDSLDLLARDESVDVVVAITDSQASLNDVEIGYEDELVAEVRAAAQRHTKPFIIASSSSLSLHPSRVSGVDDAVPVIRGIGNALAAIVAATTATAKLAEAADRPAALPDDRELAALRERVRAAAGTFPTSLGDELLQAYGISTPPSFRTDSLEEATSWAHSLGFPVVIKIDSPEIAHRTEVGGVVVGIGSADELHRAWNDMLARVRDARPDARIDGVQLQRQLTGAIEAMIGAVSNPGIGATVGVGLGGVLVELIRDAADAFAPLSPLTARRALSRTSLRALLDGYRNLNPVVDDQDLVEAVVKVSWLMHDFRGLIAEFEANPVLVDTVGGRAYAVDVLLVPAPLPDM